MRLISLALRNIRSYTNAKIDFPTGIVMLSGDIGSGKSTVLLAIEFALFGILRGELSGNALLRNGALEGSVELAFEANGKQYSIRRTLRRNRKSVEQEAGAIFVNGIKKEATALELKSQILEILGYPEELLTKTKNLIYRYTVYTPQEEMKHILLEDKDNRVAILRKVFDIDKYQRIKQNSSVYAKILRERKREKEALLADFEEKKQLSEKTKKEREEAIRELKHAEPELGLARAKVVELKNKTREIEEARQKAETLARE
ncbi:MAG TPA: SMC family ATPase, partial [Candidatus Nanoarchaeia archaeon]|nr:SMC family ATPase [Candidatus Nanoarchaeia archaeon]